MRIQNRYMPLVLTRHSCCLSTDCEAHDVQSNRAVAIFKGIPSGYKCARFAPRVGNSFNLSDGAGHLNKNGGEQHRSEDRQNTPRW